MEISENKLRAVVVDDDPGVLYAASRFLKHLGYAPTCFRESADALQQFEAGFFPEVVLTDLYMPVHSGLEVLEETRKRKRDLPVIIMTGTRDFFSTVNALNRGADGFLLKPLVMEEMKNILERVSREHHLRRKLGEEHEKLIKAQSKAELGILAAGVAHEINNPNCTILGNVEFALKIWQRIEPLLASGHGKDLELARSELPKVLQAIMTGSNRISSIITGIKAMAFAGGDGSGSAGFCDFRRGIENAKQTLRTPLRGIRIITDDLAPGVMHVKAQADQWNQIVVNLLSFAAHSLTHHPKKEPAISLLLEEIEGGTIRVTFADNGVGIPEEVIDRLAAENGSPPNGGEEGLLALFVTKILVRRGGGIFSARQNKQGGTTTMVQFPGAD